MAQVQLAELIKRFGEQIAVDRLTLTIESGEFFSLLGPSGCGKTTTLRMIAGLERPDSGRVLFDGRHVTDLPAYRRDIGMVFQNYALFPHLTVAGNVAYGLAGRGLSRAERARRVEAALERVALPGYGPRRVTELSGGQQQRVAVARAIVIEPAVLLLDEPLSNLDAKLRLDTRAELRRLQRELRITTIYVTHDQEEALALSDRIALLAGGRLQQVGSPTELYDRPANAFVAAFLGGANVVEVEVVAAGVVRLPSGETVRVPTGEACIGERRKLCVRPEAIAFDGDGPEAVVETATFAGSAYHYELRVGSARWRATIDTRRGRPCEPGHAVRLGFVPDALSLLPPE